MRGELGEACDLPLSLRAGRVACGQAGDQLGDAVSDLEREVWGGGPGEGADVGDRDVAASEAVRSL